MSNSLGPLEILCPWDFPLKNTGHSVVSNSLLPHAFVHVPLSMEFSREEHWSVLPFLPPGDLPDPKFEPKSPVSPALAVRFFSTEPPGKPKTPHQILWVGTDFGGRSPLSSQSNKTILFSFTQNCLWDENQHECTKAVLSAWEWKAWLKISKKDRGKIFWINKC